MASKPDDQQVLRVINTMARARRINTATAMLPLLCFGYAI
jgi:hypothetical protein